MTKIDLSNTYIDRILVAFKALVELFPFDEPTKIEKAAPLWQELYDVLAFTSVDTVTESVVSDRGSETSKNVY